MTLSAQRQGDKITVRTTYGPVTNEVTEDVSHVKHFSDQLLRLLQEGA